MSLPSLPAAPLAVLAPVTASFPSTLLAPSALPILPTASLLPPSVVSVQTPVAKAFAAAVPASAHAAVGIPVEKAYSQPLSHHMGEGVGGVRGSLLSAATLVDASGRPLVRDSKEGADGAAEGLAGLFDGSGLVAENAADDGVGIHPRVVTDTEALEPRALRAKVAALAADAERVLPALRESVALGDWNGPGTTLDSRACGDAAPKLALLLRALGRPVRVVEAEFHYYVLYEGSEGQVVIDPTFRQFFGGKNAPADVPTVFVGTIGDLHRFFREHAAVKTTRYDPDRIYFREGRVRDDRVAELARRGGADLAPLTAFLREAKPAPVEDAPHILTR
ncbi:MAG: hypothetical protein WC969_01775 [Elusimicrobiota bacterium]